VTCSGRQSGLDHGHHTKYRKCLPQARPELFKLCSAPPAAVFLPCLAKVSFHFVPKVRLVICRQVEAKERSRRQGVC
jgi:hypothetical protein